jgi:glycosyltransferase involved in cell wall biosynthesis
MKIVHMTSVHPPFDTRIFFRECKTLAKAGWNVVLIAKHDKNEVVDGIRIRALSKSKRRLLGIPNVLKNIYKIAVEENADIYHFHDPELIPVALLLKFKGKIVIYDVHEDYPASLLTGRPWLRPGLRIFLSKLITLVEIIGVMSVTRVIAATPHIARRFPKVKTSVIQNFPLITELVTDTETAYSNRKYVFAYVGVMSSIRGAREMVMACNLMSQYVTFELDIAGTFSPPSFEGIISKIDGWGKVKFLGVQSRTHVASLLGNARAGLVLFHPAPNHIHSQPNKIFEYMSAGIPVIASDFPLWRKIIKDNECGLLVNPLDPESIADSLKWILSHPNEAEQMGKKGKEAIERHYNWNAESMKLLYLYQNIKSPEADTPI